MRKTLSICAAWLAATVALSGCEGPGDSTETTAVPSALSTGNGLKGEYFDNMDFTNVGTAVGTNTKSITLESSKLQGLN